MSYKAIITKITNVEPHPNADRLRITKILGYNVVIGLDTEVDDRVILFPPDGQLSEIYAEKNDLVGYKDPETGERKGGFFEKNRRVKATRLRSVKSEAYIADIESLAFTGVDLNSLEDGMEFNEINGFKICDKYYTPATIRAMQGGRKQRRANDFFHKHFDTAQYRRNKNDIQKNAIIYINLKLHGTSARGGFVLDTKKLNLNVLKKFWNKTFGHIFGMIKPKEQIDFDYLIGTRNVILDNPDTQKGFYKKFGSSEQFRFDSFNSFKEFLHKGETVYSELVGFVDENTPIMPFVATEKANNKELQKKYGEKMKYLYGCNPPECHQYVYRITQISDDGFVTELPYYQMVRRVKEMGLKTAPLLCDPFIFDGDFEKLDEIVESFTEGPDLIDDSHIREGIVIRAENPDGTTVFLKNKSFDFLLLEGAVKSDDNYVDIEETS